MNKFLKVGIILVLVVIGLLFVGAVYQYSYYKNVQNFTLQETTKTREQAIKELGATGVCIGCDFSMKPGKDKELPDLRQAVQLARSKGLEINLSRSNLVGFILSGANLSGANLSGTNLGFTDFDDADLTDANLSGAMLGRTNLKNTNLTKANLHGVLFQSINFHGTNLTDADLTGAIFLDSEMLDTKLVGADLRGATITISLAGADLTGAKLDNIFIRLFYKWSYFLMVFCVITKQGIMNKFMGSN